MMPSMLMFDKVNNVRYCIAKSYFMMRIMAIVMPAMR